MKIEITLEVIPERVKALVRTFEKEHYIYESVHIVGDGDVLLDWRDGQATNEELKQIRRLIVDAGGGPIDLRRNFSLQDLQEVCDQQVEEYKAGADWVKPMEKSVKASQRRRAKQNAEQQTNREQREKDEQSRLALIREILRDEDLNQQVQEAQGGTRIPRTRIKEMVVARIAGQGDWDPRPVGEAEEKLWGRICRGAEAQATFDLPSRFYGTIGGGFQSRSTTTIQFSF